MTVNYNSWYATNPDGVMVELKTNLDKVNREIDQANIDLADINKRKTPLWILSDRLHPYHYWIQYNSIEDLNNIEKTIKNKLSSLEKDKESAQKMINDFNSVILGDKKYSEVFPHITPESNSGVEYVIKWPEWANRGIWFEEPGKLYLWKYEDYKIKIKGPDWERHNFEFTEWNKDNRDIFSNLVSDTADAFYQARANVNKWYNIPGPFQGIRRRYYTYKGRKQLEAPLKNDALYSRRGYNKLQQDLIWERLKQWR